VNALSPTVVAVDGEFYLHRILHVPEIANMKTASGMCTGGLYGVLTTIHTTLCRFPGVRRCIVVFDSGHSARRLSILPEYKRNREPTPDKLAEYTEYRARLVDQKERLIRILPSMGVRLAILPCKEGDDILGWMSKNVPGLLVLASEDKDMLQLVSDNVAVYRPIKNEFVTVENFQAATGVPRSLFLLRKAIGGDQSDNIAGVPKAGEVTINRLMETVAHIVAQRKAEKLSQAVVDACDIQMGVDTRGKARYQSIKDNLSIVSRNLDLMDLRREPFTPSEEDALRLVLDSGSALFEEAHIRKTFQELEFQSLLAIWEDFSRPFRGLR
jgi:5'-3' exonuclease